LFGAEINWYDENGKAVYGKVQESYKNAIREIAKWYKEGLIDTEIYSRGQQTREQLLSQNIGGSTHDWVSSTGKYYDLYKDTIDGFQWDGMLPPADINGVVKEIRSRSVLHGEGWGISKDNKHIETTMKYFDFWMGEVGRELIAYGVEGVHYTVEGGKKVFTDQVLNAQEGVPTYMRNQGQVEIGTVGDIAAEYAGMNENSQKVFMMYEDGGFVRKQFNYGKLTEEEEEEVSGISTDINTYVDEMSQKWILGTADVDADWDKYIATIKGMGYDTWEKVINQAYDRQKETLKK
ncbi:MAG: ABC transporter permease, partial [Clostridia bacterium]|nr:ABC transporter permease [Clostridia bacterium]